jgi:hypothetical protein
MLTAASTTDAGLARSHVREAEHAARRLMMRAVHLEKLARRSQLGSAHRASLEARARDLRVTADGLLTEVCELSRHLRAA